MDENRVLEVINKYCILKGDKKYLPCNMAFQIAKKVGEDVSSIGQLCNEHKIKIKGCQLGCF